ncbi:MAG TPA: hypothetical protein PLX65_12185, partial [Accumulibacter sp.]|nr:hypothetical protein [Accumulibacter sp.]
MNHHDSQSRIRHPWEHDPGQNCFRRRAAGLSSFSSVRTGEPPMIHARVILPTLLVMTFLLNPVPAPAEELA